MGSKNCPETPRQKMIGMMYLFLTAMLAINVDPTILNSFSKVDESLRTSVSNFGEQNRLVYERFKDQEEKNKTKVEALHKEALLVQEKSKEMIAYIQSFKDSIAIKADGEKFRGADSIENIGDTEIPSAFLLSPLVKQENTIGAKIKDAIVTYKKDLVGIAKDKQTQRIVERSLATDVSKGAGGGGHHEKEGPITWEQQMFDGRPVIAAVAMLTKIQNDVKNAESVVINNLFNQIGATDFKVNKLDAFIIPKSTYIMKGGKFEAQIGISAYDDTQKPTISVVNNPGRLVDDVYEISANTVGKKKINGRVFVNDPVTGQPVGYPFPEVEYEVYEPFAAVSADKMNVLYAGVENPISVAVPGVSSSDITLKLDNGSLSPNGGGYIAKPKKVGDAFFTVIANIDGKPVPIGKPAKFRVKSLPPPTPYLSYPTKAKNPQGKFVTVPARFQGGSIRKRDLIQATEIGAELLDADFEVEYKMLGFELRTYTSLGNAKIMKTKSNKFDSRQLAELRKLTPGKEFFLLNFRVIGPDGIEKKLPPMAITVTN